MLGENVTPHELMELGYDRDTAHAISSYIGELLKPETGRLASVAYYENARAFIRRHPDRELRVVLYGIVESARQTAEFLARYAPDHPGDGETRFFDAHLSYHLSNVETDEPFIAVEHARELVRKARLHPIGEYYLHRLRESPAYEKVKDALESRRTDQPIV